jgi:ribosomal protein S18 acetylase RimI-like enzyme
VDNSECYIGIFDNKIIATIVYRSPKVTTNHEWYDQPFVASFGQFAVDPQFQEVGIGSKLIELVEKLAIPDKAVELSFDTAEGAVDLIEFYKKRGYQFVTYTQWEVTNYRSVIMTKKLISS